MLLGRCVVTYNSSIAGPSPLYTIIFTSSTEVVARKHGLSPKTLGNWVRQYQDEVDDLMVKKQNETKQIQQDAAQFQGL
ncbi:hypothetical protein A3844_08375 [Paenibacillus helianthi]|uniref:Transposase n=1 Tax=Paenibacillus helianthi TaxID=1349432 RepID=A0ABX3EUP3_9BACL|nr:transposase [Paenibacillus helianthi]OKP88374.1 hypothetical protein A3844_08375 [Paenibacillus helianthi]